MKRVGVLATMLLASAVCAATDISIGGVPLQIPSPAGFSPVTPHMAELYELQKQFVAPTNEEFVAFIPDSEVSAALSGAIPDLRRRFAVQTAKHLVGRSVSTAEFTKLKDTIKSENDEVVRKFEREIPGLMTQVNAGLAEKHDLDLAISVSQMVPLPVHEESDRTLSSSALVSYRVDDDSGNPVPYVAAVTTTFVHVSGKILFLYSFAEEDGFQWSRDASLQWARAVVLANPSDLQSSMKESLPPAIAGIDWSKVGGKAIAGAIIGLLIGLIGWAVARRKAS